MFNSIYFSLLVFSLIVNLVFTGYLILKKLKNLAVFYYILFMFGIVVHVFGDLMFQLSGANKWAVFGILLYWIGYFLIGVFFFLFTTEYPKKRPTIFSGETGKLSVLLLPLVMIYVLLYSRDFIQELIIVNGGVNYVIYGTIYGVAIGYLLLFLGAGLFLILTEYFNTQISSEKNNLKLIFLGTFFGIFFGIIGDAYLWSIFGETKFASLFVLLGATIISYAVFNHKIFDIVPKSEDEVYTKPIFSTEYGKNYFIHETKFPSKALRYFSDQVRHKRQGLIVSTIYPKQINQRYGLKETPIIWLSDLKEKNLKSISPKKIDLLNNTLASFLSVAQKPVLLIEGIRELVIYNGSNKTISFIRSITSKAIEKNANVFFSLTKLEPDFVETANEIDSLEGILSKVEKKFLTHKITEETYLEILEENEQKLARARAELKVIEDEMVEKIVHLSKEERELLVLKTMISQINYSINKRQLRTETGEKLLKETHKELVEIERKIKKKQGTFEGKK